MKTYLGVDAGNSKTVALVCDEQGSVLGWGRAGVGDIYGAPDEETATRNVFAAVDAALSRAGGGAGQLHHTAFHHTAFHHAASRHAVSHHAAFRLAGAAFCLAGVDWPEDREFWRVRIAEHMPELGPFSVRNDGFATLRAGSPGGAGIAVSVGTGPAVAARAMDGTERCLGWWCFDHLGGDGLGGAGLRAVYQAHQGLARPTALTGELTRLYGRDSAPELLHAFTRRDDPLPHELRGRAARAVLACAAGGDPVAQQIVDEQALAFAGYAWWVGREAGFDPDHDEVPVVLGGSVVTSDVPILRDLLARRIKERIPAAQTTVADLPPAVGALMEALTEDGVVVGTDLRARLAGADVPRQLFATDGTVESTQ